MNTSIKILIAAVVAAGIGFGIHVIYGQGLAMAYVQEAAQTGRLNNILTQPYPSWVVFVAGGTALLPTLVKVLLYVLIKPRLPSTTSLGRGLMFGLLLLAIDDAFLRMPIMNVVVGNPVDVMLIQSLEAWAISLCMGLVIALIMDQREGRELA